MYVWHRDTTCLTGKKVWTVRNRPCVKKMNRKRSTGVKAEDTGEMGVYRKRESIACKTVFTGVA